MLFNSEIKILKQLDASKYPLCNDALLISVRKGKAALKRENYGSEDCGDDKDWYIRSAVTLNGVPLIQKKGPICPTCAGLLATGYGIDKNNEELRVISNTINSEFVSLEKSIENIKPLLGLLEDGVYVVADIPAYPTDGSGNYFWAVQNKLVEVPATTEICFTEDGDTVAGFPLFLYPSQSTDNFNEDRVKHYLETVSNKNAPRAISFFVEGFVSVLLDGHHKAAAAALSGVPVNCLTIIPFTSYVVNPPGDVYFSEFTVNRKDIPLNLRNSISFKRIEKLSKNVFPKQILEGSIIKRQWEAKYLSSSKLFPDINELAHQMIYKLDIITDEVIEECYSEVTSESSKKLKCIIAVLNRKKDARCKSIALKCAKLENGNPRLGKIEPPELCSLREAAFKVLVKMKEDKEAEQFFIDFLVKNNKENSLKKIADSYWD